MIDVLKSQFTVKNILLIVLAFLWLTSRCSNEKLDKYWKRYTIEQDSIKKDMEGTYAKLVDNISNSKRDLQKKLKAKNDSLSDLIKKKDEKILSLTEYAFTLKNRPVKTVTVYRDPKDSSIVINDYYPDSINYFIKHITRYNIKSNIGSGEFKFGKLNIDAVLTETKEGLWNARLVGPDWFVVDKIEVNSLPPGDYNSSVKRFYWLIGGGGTKYIDRFAINATGGININNSWLILGDISTYPSYGAKLLKQF